MRSKAYKLILPASYIQYELHLIESWSFDNCYRAAILRTEEKPMWACIRENARSKCEWLRSVRGVFNALRFDVQALSRDGWLALCVEPEASEIIRAAGNSRDAHQVDDTAQDDTRDVLMPSARRCGASLRAGSTFKTVKN